MIAKLLNRNIVTESRHHIIFYAHFHYIILRCLNRTTSTTIETIAWAYRGEIKCFAIDLLAQKKTHFSIYLFHLRSKPFLISIAHTLIMRWIKLNKIAACAHIRDYSKRSEWHNCNFIVAFFWAIHVGPNRQHINCRYDQRWEFIEIVCLYCLFKWLNFDVFRIF